jgi:hypothetical protein
MKVNYVDILLYTAKMLKTNFPKYNIYVDENERVITVPSFFVEVIPLKTENRFDSTKYKTENLIIEYVNRQALKQDKLQTIDDLDELLGDSLTVTSNGNTRVLPIFYKKATMTTGTNILASLEYFDGKAEPQKTEDDRSYDDLMKILSLNIKEEEK